MNNRRLARKARRQARRAFKRGVISTYEYDSVMFACNDQEILSEWNRELEAINPWRKGILKGSWKNSLRDLWNWFSNNWEECLRILMALLPLILAERLYENSKPFSRRT